MGMTLDKLMQVQQYSSNDLNKMRNPFREWSRTAYGGNTANVSCQKPIKDFAEQTKLATTIHSGWGKSEHLLVDDLPIYGPSTLSNNSSLHTLLSQHAKTFLHFLIPTALVLILLFAICVAFLCIMTRRRYIFRQTVLREVRRSSDSNNNPRVEQSTHHNSSPNLSINIPSAQPNLAEESSSLNENDQMKLPVTLKVYIALKKIMTYMIDQVSQKDEQNGKRIIIKDKNPSKRMDTDKEIILKMQDLNTVFPAH